MRPSAKHVDQYLDLAQLLNVKPVVLPLTEEVVFAW